MCNSCLIFAFHMIFKYWSPCCQRSSPLVSLCQASAAWWEPTIAIEVEIEGTPKKTNVARENPPCEDVFPIENVSRIQDPTHLAHRLEITFKDVFFDDLSNPWSYDNRSGKNNWNVHIVIDVKFPIFPWSQDQQSLGCKISQKKEPSASPKSLRNPTPSCSVQSRPQCLQLSFCNRMAILKTVSQRKCRMVFVEDMFVVLYLLVIGMLKGFLRKELEILFDVLGEVLIGFC